MKNIFLLSIFFFTSLFSNINDFRKNLLLYKNDQDNIELLSSLLNSFDELNVNEVKRAQHSLSDNSLGISALRNKYKNYLMNIKKQQEMPLSPVVVEKIVKTKVDFNSGAAKILDNVRQEFISLTNKISTFRGMKESPAKLFPKMLNEIEESYKKLKNINKITNEKLIKEKIVLEEVLEAMYADLSLDKKSLKSKYSSEKIIETPNYYSPEEKQIFESLVQARIGILNFFNQLSGDITSSKAEKLALMLEDIRINISNLKDISNQELKKQKEDIELLLKDYSYLFKNDLK